MGQTKTLAKNSQKTHLRLLFLAPLWRFSARLFFVFFSVTWKPVGKRHLWNEKPGKFHPENHPKTFETTFTLVKHLMDKKTHPFSNRPNKNTLQIMAKTTFTSTGGFSRRISNRSPRWCRFPARQGMTLLGFGEAAAVEPSHEPSDWVFYRKNLWKLGENIYTKSKETFTNQPRKRRFWIFKKYLMGFLVDVSLFRFGGVSFFGSSRWLPLVENQGMKLNPHSLLMASQ